MWHKRMPRPLSKVLQWMRKVVMWQFFDLIVSEYPCTGHGLWNLQDVLTNSWFNVCIASFFPCTYPHTHAHTCNCIPDQISLSLSMALFCGVMLPLLSVSWCMHMHTHTHTCTHTHTPPLTSSSLLLHPLPLLFLLSPYHLTYPLHLTLLLQWQVMKLCKTSTTEILVVTGYQAYPFSSLSVSDGM